MFRNLVRLALAAALVATTWAAAADRPLDDGYVWNAETGDGDATAGTAYLGVDLRDVTSDRLAALKLKEERGAEVTMVDQDAPAGKAGLKEHDVILGVNGQRVESVEQLRRMIKETLPGRTITLDVSRDGQPLSLKATLADRRKMKMADKMWMTPRGPVALAPPVVTPPVPAMDIPNIEVNVRSYSNTGIVIESLSPQLGEYFGVQNGEGVLVRSVEKGSAAEKAGLKAGDVIIRVDKDRISDRGDWRNAMRKRSGKVNFGIIRDRREQSITVTLPENSNPDNSFRFDLPDLDLEGLQQELNALRPEIARATAEAMQLAGAEMRRNMRDAQAHIHREMKKAQKDIEKSRKDMEKAQREAEKALEQSAK
ncbi:MAG TPA: PDZ domain-containing protein [Terriglobales bacterium]|nr:PDZ domain-containing protein [Terriglobales bacterium]